MARISKQDAAFLDRFHSGAEPRAYTYFGAHQTRKRTGEEGVTFRVWAPNATGVSVVGDFNGWDPKAAKMRRVDDQGVWECFVSGLPAGTAYQYCMIAANGNTLLKMDPYGARTTAQPRTESVVAAVEDYTWNDASWMAERKNFGMAGPSTSIRCMPVPGAAMRTASSIPMQNWRRLCPIMSMKWATTIWN